VRREYPSGPVASVGVIVLRGKEVLLVRRGQEPSRGLWSTPGGVIELGETLREAARREVREECSIEVEPGEVIEVVERIFPDENGRIRFHYVLIDLAARYLAGEARPASDILECRWVRAEELESLELTQGLIPIIRKALDKYGQQGRSGWLDWRRR